jgi:hypothetical protein
VNGRQCAQRFVYYLLPTAYCLLAKPRLRTQESPQVLLNPPEYPVPANSGGRAFQKWKARVGRRKSDCAAAAQHGINRQFLAAVVETIALTRGLLKAEGKRQ